MVDLCALVLAAGRGTRLRPLSDLLPKPLCPVNNRALLDLALDQVAELAAEITVNAHYQHEAIAEHLAARPVRLSVEQPVALGTAGAVGNVRDWVAGRGLLVANADAWRAEGLAALADLAQDWDGERVRLLVAEDPERGDFGPLRYAGAGLLPWRCVRALPAEPAGLYEVCWRPEEGAGRLDFVRTPGAFVDCGTPRDYLTANLLASGGESVVGEGARIEGEIVRCVVWPGGIVRRGERLVECIRVGADITVLAGVDPRPS